MKSHENPAARLVHRHGTRFAIWRVPLVSGRIIFEVWRDGESLLQAFDAESAAMAYCTGFHLPPRFRLARDINGALRMIRVDPLGGAPRKGIYRG